MLAPRIVFTGDILRCDGQGKCLQTKNIRWLWHLASPLLQLLCGNKLDCVSGHPDEPATSLIYKFYSAAGASLGLDTWAQLYGSQCNGRQLAILEALFSGSLVVSYELSDILAGSLSRLGIPYVDFTIHPVRFMRELAFGVRSNIPALQEQVQKWSVSREAMLLEAGTVQALFAQREDCQLPECEVAIFACQTQYDRTLIRNGKTLGSEDLADELATMCASHERVYVKLHPCSKNSQVATFLLSEFRNTCTLEYNIYQSICQKQINAVYSISSSSSIEASLLGKPGIHLTEYPLHFSESELSDHVYMQVNSCFLDPVFWTMILDKLNMNHNETTVTRQTVDLRRSLGQFWGADVLYK